MGTAPLSSIGSLDTLERIPTPAEAGTRWNETKILRAKWEGLFLW